MLSSPPTQLRLSCSCFKMERQGGDSCYYKWIYLNTHSVNQRSRDWGSSLLFVLWCIVVESIYLPLKHACNTICLFPLSSETDFTRTGCKRLISLIRQTRLVSKAIISTSGSNPLF
jgi:hypothetical protein